MAPHGLQIISFGSRLLCALLKLTLFFLCVALAYSRVFQVAGEDSLEKFRDFIDMQRRTREVYRRPMREVYLAHLLGQLVRRVVKVKRAGIVTRRGLQVRVFVARNRV
jgi:hypothetical protein